MKHLCLALLASTALAALSACAGESGSGGDSKTACAAPAGVVNVYTSRHYDTDLALYEDFTCSTGIKVNRLEADADALIERIAAEGEYSQADLFVTVDHGAAPDLFDHLARAGILVRRFDAAARRLRFGLPGDAGAWGRLEQALAAFTVPCAPEAVSAETHRHG